MKASTATCSNDTATMISECLAYKGDLFKITKLHTHVNGHGIYTNIEQADRSGNIPLTLFVQGTVDHLNYLMWL